MTRDKAVVQLNIYKKTLARLAKLKASDSTGKSPEDREMIKDTIHSMEDLIQRMEVKILHSMIVTLSENDKI